MKRILVERGTVLKRFHARAKGRGIKHHQADLPHLRDRRRRARAEARARERLRSTHGTEDQSDRFPPRRAAATGTRAGSRTARSFSTMLNEDLKVRDFLKRKLAHASVSKVIIERPGEGRAHHHPQRAARRGDRQEGRGHRAPEGRAAPAPRRADGAREHRGDPQARDRRAAHRRLDRAAAREADHVPPRDEARDAERDAPRRAGHQDHERRPAERHRDRAHRVVPRGARAAAHAACGHRLRRSARRRRPTA